VQEVSGEVQHLYASGGGGCLLHLVHRRHARRYALL
jgi:hypothetical protein